MHDGNPVQHGSYVVLHAPTPLPLVRCTACGFASETVLCAACQADFERDDLDALGAAVLAENHCSIADEEDDDWEPRRGHRGEDFHSDGFVAHWLLLLMLFAALVLCLLCSCGGPVVAPDDLPTADAGCCLDVSKTNLKAVSLTCGADVTPYVVVGETTSDGCTTYRVQGAQTFNSCDVPVCP
jgi:hypothetical protein